MSLSASSLLARLDELRKWQEKQQERLSQQQLSRAETTDASNYKTIEGLSEFDSSLDITKNNSKDTVGGILIERDSNLHKNKNTSPALRTEKFQEKSPEMYLKSATPNNENTPIVQKLSDNIESKSAKFTNDSVPVRQKRPFLKRGSGLIRYKMNPGDQNRSFSKVIKRKSNLKANSTSKRNHTEDIVCLKNEDIQMTPLKKPDLNMKAVWFKIQSNDEQFKENTEEEPIDKAINKHLLLDNASSNVLLAPVQETTSHLDKFSSINKQTMDRDLKELGQDRVENVLTEETLVKKTVLQINEIIAQKIDVPINRQLLLSYENRNEEYKMLPYVSENVPSTNQTENPSSDQTLYEKQLEKELLIFEALEEKAMNNSFSSTNSSILRILSSTPSKIRNRNVERKIEAEVIQSQQCIESDLMERLETPISIDEQYDQTKNDSHKNIKNSFSSDSSVTSEDFETKTMEKQDFKDESPWSDVNILTRENSSLSSASVKTDGTSRKDDTLVSEVIETKACKKSIECDDSKELLAKKLTELDREIQNFRRENAKLQKEKFDLEKEKRQFKKEKKAFEKYVLEEKINVEFYLEDEKKKLAKEKLVFERYVKDCQNKTNRKEREEISSLKEEVANLKEAAKLKETRNATSQARLRNQIKMFEKDVCNLKEELDKLRKQNAKLTTTQKLNRKSSETKMLHEINKNLSKLTQDVKVSEQLKKMEESIEKKKLLSDSLETEEDMQKTTLDKRECSDFYYGKDKSKPKSNMEPNQLEKSQDMCYKPFLEDKQRRECNKSSNKLECSSKNEKFSDINEEYLKNITDVSLERNYDRVFNNADMEEVQDHKTTDNSKVIPEITLTNGTKMISYPNGNIKTISADGNNITMKYYNGDVKETDCTEGIIRYYYAENESWQTTMADGTEIIEFPSGQIEKKFRDGSTEIKFPNGIVRLVKPDGSESISYADNTKIDIHSNGQKTIYIPNGQKEVHTSEHMRREYPDGTVKILYPDGIQETRYSNGRIRVKDKDGRLLMDTYDDNT